MSLFWDQTLRESIIYRDVVPTEDAFQLLAWEASHSAAGPSSHSSAALTKEVRLSSGVFEINSLPRSFKLLNKKCNPIFFHIVMYLVKNAATFKFG